MATAVCSVVVLVAERERASCHRSQDVNSNIVSCSWPFPPPRKKSGHARRRWYPKPHCGHHLEKTHRDIYLAGTYRFVAAGRPVPCPPHRSLPHRTTQVRALGALLTHLQSTVFALEESGSVGVTAVRQLDVSGSMRIDGMTLRFVVGNPLGRERFSLLPACVRSIRSLGVGTSARRNRQTCVVEHNGAMLSF